MSFSIGSKLVVKLDPQTQDGPPQLGLFLLCSQFWLISTRITIVKSPIFEKENLSCQTEMLELIFCERGKLRLHSLS